jgi:hypothetical protein
MTVVEIERTPSGETVFEEFEVLEASTAELEETTEELEAAKELDSISVEESFSGTKGK